MATITPTENIPIRIVMLDADGDAHVQRFVLQKGVNYNVAALRKRIDDFIAANNTVVDAGPSTNDLTWTAQSSLPAIAARLVTAGKIILS